MSRLEEFVPLFQLISGNLLSKKEICTLLSVSNQRIIDYFGEIAYNFCVSGTVHLSKEEKKYLSKFQYPLRIIAHKKTRFTIRRKTLSRNPQLVRALAKYMLEKIWKN